VRHWGAAALGQIGDAGAVASLIAALGDPEYLVRAEAAKALGTMGDPRALGPLETVLATDPVEYVRDYAARALGHFPASAVFERLLQALQDPSAEVRCGAIVALAQTAGTQALPTLAALLVDPEPAIRGMAALELATVGDQSVVPALEQMKAADHALWGANPVSNFAAYALEQIHARLH
jgi:HEAT repeat protein